jgi:hypothetical protein
MLIDKWSKPILLHFLRTDVLYQSYFLEWLGCAYFAATALIDLESCE